MYAPRIQRALVSVSDKLGLAGFARGLVAAGVEIYSTGGTRKHLESEGIPVRDVSEYTGFPEMMDGRLKTLHPKVHGGILCRHDNPEDMQCAGRARHPDLRAGGGESVSLRNHRGARGSPAKRRSSRSTSAGRRWSRGGPKNHAFTTMATGAAQYSRDPRSRWRPTAARRWSFAARLAGEAFAHTAGYDRAIADYLRRRATAEGPFPATCTWLPDAQDSAPLRREPAPAGGRSMPCPTAPGPAWSPPEQLHGKELSYNNLLDLDSALAIVRQFSEPAAVVIKHNNPCGAAVAATLAGALQRALAGDPLSAFGSVLGLNRPVDAATAEVLASPGLFVEAIVAPDFDAEALEILTTRPKWKANVRLMEVGELDRAAAGMDLPLPRGRCADAGGRRPARPRRSRGRSSPTAKPSDAAMVRASLRLGLGAAREVERHRAVKDRMLLGTGAGQMSRVDSTEIAIKKAGERVRGRRARLRRLLPVPRLDRTGRRGRRGRRRSSPAARRTTK